MMPGARIRDHEEGISLVTRLTSHGAMPLYNGRPIVLRLLICIRGLLCNLSGARLLGGPKCFSLAVIDCILSGVVAHVFAACHPTPPASVQ